MLISPEGTQRCDCGYWFTVAPSPPTAPPEPTESQPCPTRQFADSSGDEIEGGNGGIIGGCLLVLVGIALAFAGLFVLVRIVKFFGSSGFLVGE